MLSRSVCVERPRLYWVAAGRIIFSPKLSFRRTPGRTSRSPTEWFRTGRSGGVRATAVPRSGQNFPATGLSHLAQFEPALVCTAAALISTPDRYSVALAFSCNCSRTAAAFACACEDANSSAKSGAHSSHCCALWFQQTSGQTHFPQRATLPEVLFPLLNSCAQSAVVCAAPDCALNLVGGMTDRVKPAAKQVGTTRSTEPAVPTTDV